MMFIVGSQGFRLINQSEMLYVNLLIVIQCDLFYVTYHLVQS